MKIAFDIDDTLWKIRRKQRDQVPDYGMIQVLKWFYDNGDEIYVWSAGGLDFANTIVRKLGLDEMVTVIRKGKDDSMDISFDDETVSLAKTNVTVRRCDVHRCVICKIPYIPDPEAIPDGSKEWDGHTFMANCDCVPKDWRLCIGGIRL